MFFMAEGSKGESECIMLKSVAYYLQFCKTLEKNNDKFRNVEGGSEESNKLHCYVSSHLFKQKISVHMILCAGECTTKP